MMFTPYFALGAVVMAAGTAAFTVRYARSGQNGAYHGLVAAVAGMATAAYALMAVGIGTVSVDGAPLFVPRYVDWLVTTPLIVTYLGLLAGASRGRLAVLVVLDVLMVASGPVATVVDPPLSWVAFAVGALCELGLLYGLLATLSDTASQRAWSVQALFQKLRNLTVVTWAFYPVVWLLGPHGLGVLLPFADVMVVVYLDVVAKVGFGLVALQSTAALGRMAEHGGTASTT